MKTAVLLVNLGTPAEPTRKGVRDFLAPFLSDRRVVDLPPMFWLPLLHCIVLPFRSGRVAKLYQSIWTEEGSPLLCITKLQVSGVRKVLEARLAAILEEKLQQQEGKAPTEGDSTAATTDAISSTYTVDPTNKTTEIIVSYAMTYTEPSIADEINRLYTVEKAERIIVLPLYPHYSSSTIGPIYTQIGKIYETAVNVPDFRIVHDYYRRADFINALANSVRRHRESIGGGGQMLVMSFHGIPRKFVVKGDPYEDHCHANAALVAEALGLKPEEWRVCFQSRFGNAEWVQPYTDDLLAFLPTPAGGNITRVDMMCPAFAADCLETLEEIADCSRHVFMDAGGEHYSVVPCLNACTDHLEMLANMAMDEMRF